MIILGIETSCDETAVAVVEDGTRVRSNVIATAGTAFAGTGGVIPEQAARMQVQCILPVLHQAMAEAHITPSTLDAIAVTHGPGLLGSLLCGTVTARALAALWSKPLIGVHHTLGHLSSIWLDRPDEPLQFPVLTLSASGGHTDIWLRTSHTTGVLLGRTRDDAAGEAFDKAAHLLGLSYPGGPSIARAAQEGDPSRYPLPLPLKDAPDPAFSFSGLKTALRTTIQRCESPLPVADLAASFQEAACWHLCDNVCKALRTHDHVQAIHVVGGVSANTRLRELLQTHCAPRSVLAPVSLAYCTDNAAMIASAAAFMVQELGMARASQPTETRASLPLEEALSPPA